MKLFCLYVPGIAKSLINHPDQKFHWNGKSKRRNRKDKLWTKVSSKSLGYNLKLTLMAPIPRIVFLSKILVKVPKRASLIQGKVK